MIAGLSPSRAIATQLEELSSNLESVNGVADALDLLTRVPKGIGLTRGGQAWARGTVTLRSLLGPRVCRSTALPPNGFDFLRDRLTDEQVSLLTYSDQGDAAVVQLMGLYQSKGREADATIVVLRENDYYGRESEPMPAGSKLLYVVLTRARVKTIVLTLGTQLPPLIYPLAMLASAPD